jgi:hypothetical protein
MRPLSVVLAFGFLVICVVAGTAQQQKRMPRKVPGTSKPECAAAAICFSGEIREGQTFRKELNADLEFVIGLPGGFQVRLTQADRDCDRQSWVTDPPFRVHRLTEIDAAYDWTAEQEIATSPREFRFARSCAAIQTMFHLYETVPEQFSAKLNTLADGEGRLWITAGKATHTHGINGKEQGAVEWIKYTVEIKLPLPR